MAQPALIVVPSVTQFGKQGQGVPVGVGQPHLRMDQVTVGGTQA
jgi:TldD protein